MVVEGIYRRLNKALLRGARTVRAVRNDVGISNMYIKVRKERLRDKAKSTVLRFQIVRSYRDPVTSKVRSEFIAYLASINATLCSVPVAQERFWREVDRKLAHLSLDLDDEQRIREKLLEKVPRPRSWREILAPYAKFARNRAGIR